ncbi:MAG: 30S ribosome-binding factor RbfA [Bdellovibrionales bacterium]|nr:30S ribosome-binding factor RbfA [Bdellovibrionales bacterium]
MSRRTRQVASAIREELADIVRREINDPRIETVGFVTISEVQISPDHRDGLVWVAFMGKEEKSREVQDALAALNSSSGYIHKLLVKRIPVKALPRLRFKFDRGFDRAAEIDLAFRKIDGRGAPRSGSGEEE